MSRLLAKMLHLLVLCPVLLTAVQTLTIDSQLGTSVEDCFDRISIGEQLLNSAIYRNVSELTTRECEQICKQDKQCQAYDYGVGAKGNATCDLSTLNEKEVKGQIFRHPDFDIYVRRFQCEQAPPSPMKPLLDDPDDRPPDNRPDRPHHRPIFRPDVEDNPLADYLVSSDLDPYSSGYRPDGPNRPSLDIGPSYGDHRPQDIPFRPETNRPQDPYMPDRPDDTRPPYGPIRPQDPYMPDRPQYPNRPHTGTYKPDPYRPEKPKPDPNDVLDFGGYDKPTTKPVIRPDMVNYNHFKPTRRPRPHEEYNNPDSYGSGPVGPPRPEKPIYSYNSQYAGNYGQNQNDNSVYVEIYDPPRPYVPIKDRPGQNYGEGFLGYGTYSTQNSNYQNSNYYAESITEIEHDRPQKPYGQNPANDYERPVYMKPNQPNRPDKGDYGINDNQSGGYGINKPQSIGETGYQRPNYKPQNTAFSHSHSQSYGSSQYGSSYETHRPNDSGYSKPQKPNSSYSGSDKGDYGSYGGQGSYGDGQGSYGTGGYNKGHSTQNYGSDIGSYGTTQGSYGSAQGSYGSTQGSYGQSSYGFQGSYGSGNYGEISGSYGYKGSYGGSQGSYGSSLNTYGEAHGSHSNNGYGNRPVFDYETHKPGYGNEKPEYDTKPGYGQKPGYVKPGYENERPDPAYDMRPDTDYQKPGYGIHRPSYGNDRPSYSNDKPNYGIDRPSYGNDKPSYGNDRPSYGNDKPNYGNDRPSYGNDKPSYGNDRPSYGNDKPSYGNDRPSYGNDKPSYGNDRPSYGIDKPSYGNDRPSYGNDKPNYGTDKPSYGNTYPSYDSDKPSYGSNKPSYGSDRPSYSQKPDYTTQKPAYGNPKPEYDSQQPGYGNEKPDAGYGPNNTNRPDVKPVYEYEMDKPTNVPTYISRPGGGVVTSRPVVIGDYERPVYKEPGMAACFRRVLAGRRALRSFVRKVVSCERLEDCRRECALEKRFHCESFNYRLDQSFRGKGLCELMTKPIEAFDPHRDFVDDKNYDFYEVDRNSLEPNCPETLRGPGLLHSGFLSSFDNPKRLDHIANRVEQRPNRLDQRPNRVDQSGWRDRFDWAGGYRDINRFSYDRDHGNRRFEDHFVPYQIGQARTDEHDNWGQYGGNYGGHDYYKDRNDHHKSINYWGLSSDRPTEFKKTPNFNYHSLGKNLDFDLSSHFHHPYDHTKGSRYGYGSWKRGRWNSGSNALDLEEFSRESHDEDHHETSVKLAASGDDCYSRRQPGMSLKSGAIRRSLIAHNVVECEAACFGEREFKCVSYSYRYSTSRGTDNCFLSERPYRGLEMSADSGSDVYGMPQDKACVSTRPWVESECFWHVGSGFAVGGGAVKSALTVVGLGACEAECIRAQGFFCRGFSFRFDSPTIGDEDIHNCILTSSPTTKLPRKDTPGHELYARGNYGRGCEPAVYDDIHNGECYLQYDKAAKLTGASIRGKARVRDEQSCGVACTEAPFRCLSFSYNNNAPPSSENCLLSDIRLFDLQRGVDYVHSPDDWLFAFDLFNSKCWRKVHQDTSSELPHPIVPSSGDEFPGTGPSGLSGFTPGSAPGFPYIPDSGPSGPTGPSSPASPSGPFKPEYIPFDGAKHYPIESGPSSPEKPYPLETYKPSYIDKPDESFRPGYGSNNFRPTYKPEYPDPEPYPGFQPSVPDRPDPSYKPESPSYRPDPPSYRPDPPSYRPDPPSYRPDPPSYGPETDRPFRPTVSYPKPGGFRPDRPRPGFKPEYLPEGKPGQVPQRPGFGDDRENNGPIEASWRHYTVSGFPCRAGTTCAQNQIVGHWACEPEGGEIGSWDYCCAPTHRCGYSEGFNKPWCYVGHKEDQWRPCSEKYYPYHQHNTPHPSLGHREEHRPHRPWRETPPNRTPLSNSPWPVKGTPPPVDYIPHWDKPPGPYLSEADRKYWDELYDNGPKAYYDKYGNPLPGYSRVPTESRPYIRYKATDHGPSSGHWIPVSDDRPPVPGLGAPRYWPVAYLHRGPPPNTTYFRYNETTSRPTTERQHDTTLPPPDGPESRNVGDDSGQVIDDNISTAKNNVNKEPRKDKSKEDKPRDEKTNDNNDEVTEATVEKIDVTEAPKEKEKKVNADAELVKPGNVKKMDSIKGIDDKLEDFSKSLEVLDIEDVKGDKLSGLKTLEAEERQIEAIGRLLANRRGKLVLEKRSQKDLDAKNIAVDDLEFNFGNRFSTERRGIIKRISKDEIERDNTDKSLEVSETTFVRPPRVLSTTENIRKAIVNGKVFYDATIREQRELSNSTRKSKSLKRIETTTPSVINNSNFGIKKIIRTRNANPVRRVKRVYRRKYNPGEVRKRLIERDRNKNNTDSKMV